MALAGTLWKLFRQALGELGLVKMCLDNVGRPQQSWSSNIKVAIVLLWICKNYEPGLLLLSPALEQRTSVRRPSTTALLSPLDGRALSSKNLRLDNKASLLIARSFGEPRWAGDDRNSFVAIAMVDGTCKEQRLEIVVSATVASGLHNAVSFFCSFLNLVASYCRTMWETQTSWCWLGKNGSAR